MILKGDCRNKSDSDLVSLSLRNPDWYGCLMERYELRLSRYIKRISGVDREDIEDLLQDIFLQVYRNLNSFDQAMKFSSWIYRIAHNRVISHYRKMQASAQLVVLDESEKILSRIKDDSCLADQINNKLTAEVLSGLFKKMDLKYREVLILRYLEEKDYREMSDILKKPVGSIGSLLNRAKRQLAGIIKKQRIKL